jgi:hypothetical protein
MFDYGGNYYNILMVIQGLAHIAGVLSSHTEHNSICNNIKVCTKTRLGLDYNSPWCKAPSFRKVLRSGT